MEMRSSRKAGLVLVVFGLLIPLSIWGYYGCFVNWTPVRRSVTSLSGDIEQRFRVNYTSTYSGSLEFTNHVIPGERLECLIGLKGFSPVPDCRDESIVLHFSWKVIQDGRVVDSGTYRGQGELIAGYPVATFAFFRASRGKSFTLLVHFDLDARALDSENPVLCVREDSSRGENAVILEELSPFVGGGIGVIGLTLIGLGPFRKRRLPASNNRPYKKPGD
jgi:hypothetical protein